MFKENLLCLKSKWMRTKFQINLCSFPHPSLLDQPITLILTLINENKAAFIFHAQKRHKRNSAKSIELNRSAEFLKVEQSVNRWIKPWSGCSLWSSPIWDDLFSHAFPVWLFWVMLYDFALRIYASKRCEQVVQESRLVIQLTIIIQLKGMSFTL